ncbi:CoA transferase [Pseudonocardia ailaonensis]|uniref:CoA transferase n=1 Tax=Pseudonocardia ailaonensis TaxID=367279 RepID=A0ABN2N7D0_9PSEU
MAAADPQAPPLTGITVVALEHEVALPLATRHLAEQGARVIKVESPGTGDPARSRDRRARGLSSAFVWANRGKESVELDLGAAEDVALLRRMVARADVFVHDLAPGAAEELGLGAEKCRADDPRLVHCGLSGFGERGPYTDRRPYDLLVQAEAGVLDVTGTDEERARAGIPVADIAGAMYVYSGILTALLQRGRTGTGSTLTVSLFDALVEWMGQPLASTLEDGLGPARTGAGDAEAYPYGPFETGDGEHICVAVRDEAEWKAFCAFVLDRPELAADPRFGSGTERLAHREELDRLILTSFSRLSVGEAADRLDDAEIGFARVRSAGEVAHHPLLTVRRRWREVGSAAGPVPVLPPPVDTDAYDSVVGDVPALGDANERLRAEFGDTE